MKMFFRLLPLFFCVLFLSSCSSNNYDAGYSDGYDAGRESGYNDGYNDGLSETTFPNSFDQNEYSSGYSDGYKDGFDYACAIIIDSMDKEYREQWWQENIDYITEHGIEY